MPDPITRLLDAGYPVDQLSGPQRGVLADLSDDETSLLISVHSRLRAVEDDVVAHDMKML